MKKFEDVKIVACVMMYDDDDYCQLVLDDLSKYTDEIYVNLNEPTKKIEKIVKGYLRVVKIIETKNNGGWKQKIQRENTIRMLDNVKPDIVLWPDSDETFPPDMWKILEDFWKSEHKNLWFHMWYLWDSPKKVRRDHLFKSMCHVRAFKWQAGLTYLPQCGYGAKPANLPSKGYQFHSPKPVMHYGYMTYKNRLRKYNRSGIDYANPKVQKKMNEGMIIKDVPKEFL